MADEPKIELMLSILVAIAVGFALERLMELDDFLWFAFSILSILIAVGFIYIMLETPKISLKDISRNIVILFVIWFPFTLAKMSQNTASNIFDWTENKEVVYIMLMGISFILWGVSEWKENNKIKGTGIIVFGAVIILVLIIFKIFIVAKKQGII